MLDDKRKVASHCQAVLQSARSMGAMPTARQVADTLDDVLGKYAVGMMNDKELELALEMLKLTIRVAEMFVS